LILINWSLNPAVQLIIVGKDLTSFLVPLNLGNDARTLLKEALLHVTILKCAVFRNSSLYQCNNSLCFPSFAEALPVSWIEAMALKPDCSLIGWATAVIDDG
jgi:hypothetical protein